jgi:glycosyltransferase involved in cell wall biosynthesis
MKKKVVQIVRAPAGGIRKHILTIVKGLEDQFDFYFVLSHEEGDPLYYRFLEEFPHYKNRVLNISINDQPSFSDLGNLLKVRKYIKDVGANVVHGHGAKGGLYARLSTTLSKVRVFYTAHGGALHSMHGRLKGFVFSLVEKVLYYFSDTLIFESLYTMEQYQKKAHASTEKFQLAYNAIEVSDNFDSLKVKEIDPKDKIKIGSFGLLRKIKGHRLMIEAIPLLVEKGYDISYIIFGAGEEEQNLNSLASELGVENRFSIVENVDDVDLAMKSLEIIVHPSFFESFGYVPLEATVNGISVVSSLNGGLNQVMDGGRCGFSYQNNQAADLSIAIEAAIENAEERSSRFNHFKEHIKKNFLQEVFLRKMGEIYDS